MSMFVAPRVVKWMLIALMLSSAAYGDELTARVPVGANPIAMAVNPVTNKIYVANYESANVTVIDGATNSTAVVSTGSRPSALAVNPETNKIYVTNSATDTNSVTVIDGATNATSTVSVGLSPSSVVVNPSVPISMRHFPQ